LIEKLEKPTRICTASGRELHTGEKIHSVLWDNAGTWQRANYGAEAWPLKEKLAGMVAHWVAKLPPEDAKPKQQFSDDLLIDCLKHLEKTQEPVKLALRYFLGLFLMRRKRLLLADDAKQPGLTLRERKTGVVFHIAERGWDDAAADAAEDELEALLACE
jgi:hypothetical protein